MCLGRNNSCNDLSLLKLFAKIKYSFIMSTTILSPRSTIAVVGTITISHIHMYLGAHVVKIEGIVKIIGRLNLVPTEGPFALTSQLRSTTVFILFPISPLLLLFSLYQSSSSLSSSSSSSTSSCSPTSNVHDGNLRKGRTLFIQYLEAKQEGG